MLLRQRLPLGPPGLVPFARPGASRLAVASRSLPPRLAHGDLAEPVSPLLGVDAVVQLKGDALEDPGQRFPERDVDEPDGFGCELGLDEPPHDQLETGGLLELAHELEQGNLVGEDGDPPIAELDDRLARLGQVARRGERGLGDRRSRGGSGFALHGGPRCGLRLRRRRLVVAASARRCQRHRRGEECHLEPHPTREPAVVHRLPLVAAIHPEATVPEHRDAAPEQHATPERDGPHGTEPE
jgi:hypothetical protein